MGTLALAAVVVLVAYRHFERARLDSIELESLRRVSDNLRRERTALGQELATALRSLSETTAQRDDSERELLRVVKLAIDESATVAQALTADPRLCRSMLCRATELANRYGAASDRLAAIGRSLPTPRAIPPGANVELVGVTREDGAWVIDFMVRDGRGRHVAGLHRGDVELLHGNRRLHALALSEVTRPTGEQYFAVLLDTSSSTSGPANDAMKTGATELVRSVANPSRVRVWRFADTVEAISPWTFDASLHEVAIQSLAPKGGTNLYRCIRTAAEDLGSRPGIRSIVLFTDGKDSFQQETVETVLTACRSAQIAVHVVALHTAETNESVLRRIADSTGGMYHVGSDPLGLAEHFRILAKSISRPLYRLRLNEAADAREVSLQVGALQPVLVKTPQ